MIIETRGADTRGGDNMVDDADVNAITDANATNAGLYLFYMVLTAIASLASLIILVAVLTLLLTKIGFGNILKMR